MVPSDPITTAVPSAGRPAEHGPSRAFADALRVLVQGSGPEVVWRLGATLLLTVIGSLLAGLAPLALKEMIDATAVGLKPYDRIGADPVLVFGAAYLLALCGGRLLSELRPALMGGAEQRLYARLRGRFFRHLLALPLSFHLGRRSGALGQCLHQAISGYQILVYNLINSVVPILVELVTVALVLASLEQPALMASFACTALSYLAVLARRRSGVGDTAREVSDASIETHGILADSLVNVETIKCFSAEGTAHERFEQANRNLERRWMALRHARLRMGMTVTATFALSMVASLAVALDAVRYGGLSLGGFVLANVYMLQVARPLEALGAAARDLSQALAFIRPLLDVLAEPTEASRATGATRPVGDPLRASTRESAPPCRNEATDRTPPAILFEGVRFAYDGGEAVLDWLTLDIGSGRTVAIVGASGSGKSSLIRLLLRLYEPQAGSIRLYGVHIDSLSLEAVRSQFALVSQDTVLFNAAIAFNIGIGKPGSSRIEIERAARLAGVHGFIASLPEGYDTMVGERGLRVSGGERQRIAIARALLKDAPILLFDEATSMLDSVTERAILCSLKQSSAGRTIVTVAHRLSTIQDADEILVVARGQMVERGDHQTLLAKGGAYAAMWRAQQSVGRDRPTPAI